MGRRRGVKTEEDAPGPVARRRVGMDRREQPVRRVGLEVVHVNLAGPCTDEDGQALVAR